MGIERHRRRSPRRLSEGESANGASGKRCDIDAAKWRSQIETWEVRVNQPKSKREHVPESPNTHVIYRTTRADNRKALKPQPTRQAKLVAWHLTFRVPLNFAAIPESDIKQACERYGMSLDTWQRQKHAFGLLKKVCAKRAKLRGEQHSFNRRDGRGSFLALCERLC